MLLLQLYTAVFATALAFLNKVPCEKFSFHGTSLKEDKQFHRANAIVKLIWVLSFCPISDLHLTIIMFSVLHLILWLFFDAALGYFLHGDITYIGQTAWTDKKLRKYLGEYAGITKMLIVSSAILVINFFL